MDWKQKALYTKMSDISEDHYYCIRSTRWGAEGVMMDTNTKDRATTEPGGCECEHCGCIFIGGPDHSICGDCLTAVKAALQEDAQRAEWHAEMRRDAFGGA